jgi:outer membrane autotransporter protein
VTNSGLISVDARYASGVIALSYQGGVSITNDAAGSVNANSLSGSAGGLLGNSELGDVLIDNGGSVVVVAANRALGVYAQATEGNVGISNSGDVHVDGDAFYGWGIGAIANSGSVEVTSSGSIEAMSAHGSAIGVYAAGNGPASVSNSGAIDVTGYSGSVGISALGYAATVDNSGTVHAQGHAATGVSVYGYAGAQVVNSGTIAAQSTTGGDAVGVDVRAYGNLLVYNTGTITATDDDYAVAVSVDSAHTATVVNTGTLRAYSTVEGEVAVRGGDGVQRVFNYGDIYGAIVTGGGDDALANGNGGIWNVTNHSTDFGDGDDSITNGAGGTIVLADGAIHLGASGSAGNAFTNDGRIQVQGEGLIDMGGGQAALLPSANALPLVNNGLVDFVDGMPDDILTVAGDLAGNGAISIDVSPLNHGADLLYVEGNVNDGSVQTVNVSFADFPASGTMEPIAFAHVAGDSTAGSFVAGQVVGFGANSFLDMQVYVSSQLDATNATDDIFSIAVDVAGLNDPGTLAASIASGAQSLLTSQVGTWRQRMGVLPGKDDGNVGVSPWIRVFSDKGEVDPSHAADNFGNAGNFDYDQSNSGREVGMNINFRGGFNAGLLLAKSDGTQHLVGAGVGSDHISGSAFGLYGTWIGANGFYVDASYRWFDFTADLRSVAGKQSTDGQGGAFNVEAGFTAWKLGGIDIAPQVQYTRGTIGNIRPLDDGQTDFVANGGTSSRGRVGVAFSKVIDSAGWTWTPYGSVNAVREFDGRSDYTVADTFTGSTRTDGTSAMVELGIGAQKKGFSATAGANWTDGGALQSFVGGQLVLRYTW